jgi:hypothetical protein
MAVCPRRLPHPKGEEHMAQQQKNQGQQGQQGQQQEEKGSMTVEEAGRMGGQRVRELVEEGKEQEGRGGEGGGRGGSSSGASGRGEQGSGQNR